MIGALCEAFADALSYPTAEAVGSALRLKRLAESCRIGEMGEPLDERVLASLSRFVDETDHCSVGELEELYTRTFDINPITSLEVGWHLYGEAYERGAFLVKMRGWLREHGIEESTELPDHLTHALRVLGCLEGTGADALARDSLLPALRKMLEGFAGQSSPYGHVLQALVLLLEHVHAQGVSTHG